MDAQYLYNIIFHLKVDKLWDSISSIFLLNLFRSYQENVANFIPLLSGISSDLLTILFLPAES